MSTVATKINTDAILEDVGEILNRRVTRDEKLFAVCELLDDHVDVFNWTGFYLPDPEGKDELVIGPYVGERTDHTRIPYGKGICGQVAESHNTFLVDDVSRQENYLACSLNVKSELVVPIMKEQQFVGQLDIDSHTVNAFTKNHVELIEEICKLLSKEF